MSTFKDSEGRGKTYSAPILKFRYWTSHNAAKAGIMAAAQDLMKIIPVGTEDILTITHNADGSYSTVLTSV
jgi:hypothetical protein